MNLIDIVGLLCGAQSHGSSRDLLFKNYVASIFIASKRVSLKDKSIIIAQLDFIKWYVYYVLPH